MMRAGWFGLLGAMVSTAALGADTLLRARETGTLRLGVRADAPPYSYRGASGEYSGYMVDLCREMGRAVSTKIENPRLKIEYIEVSANDRLDAVKDGKIDILCDPTSVTSSRREMVDFSYPTMIDGVGAVYRKNGPTSISEFNGKNIGVLQGTTAEQALKSILWQMDIKANIVPSVSHADGIRDLTKNKIDVYFGDRGILSYYIRDSKESKSIQLENNYYTFETYALAIQRGDGAFRALVDATLADLYRSHAIQKIYTRSFGSTVPDEFVRVLYVINGVPK
ncbi:MAG: amino acid ABC transporter substrate-binding protein [Bosea sp.]|uniref:amino acid ABC transporter substrate-binding protein n=1 Tax=Bosea sp. (in: a-proteobacteria) TaxID=1871050 RepID=UPI001AC22E4C|nr:amino acid ABC transporter substrate-binding protein [Bosea sp. (in: a-proteobacteria)]MBN9453368.1 amino acid ABC transporter substrate-binding protein [Bosea sp. (in: a-proteobacteria)]